MATKRIPIGTGPHTRRGISLLELLIVLAIVAIVAATAAPSFTALIDARRLESAAMRPAADLQLVRSEAIARQRPLRLGAGSAAVAQLQTHVRLASDVARERSEALRLGQDALEAMRAFTALDGAPGEPTYAAIASGDASVDAASSPAAHAAYRIERRVDADAAGGPKAVAVAVRWTDRGGKAREVVLHSFIAGIAPAYAGSLALGAGAVPAAARGADDRAPTLPLTARNLGDGRSVWRPDERGTVALVFDSRSGRVVGRCDSVATGTATRDLSAADLAGCATGRWLLASGTIRFSNSAPPDAATARQAPLDTALSLALRDRDYPAPPSCFSAAKKTVRFVRDGSMQIEDVDADATPASAGLAAWEDTGDRFIAWHCIVAPRADGRWSGRIALVAHGWTIGTGSGDRRVCRFAAARTVAAEDANIASAGAHVDVGAALLGRNFLVVRGSESCPPAEGAEPHQP
jgi:prepilin-type N-terminal cleavage/methylation domain-containing protein